MAENCKAGSTGPGGSPLDRNAAGPFGSGMRISWGRWGPWFEAAFGRFRLRLHLLTPVAIGAVAWSSGSLLGRYLMLLSSLVLHEAGHVIAALRLGSRTAEMELWPAFGRAWVGRLHDRREGWIAVAGPAVNLVLAGGLCAAGGRLDLHLGSADWLDFLFTVNLGMGLGNLLPVAPLDGGRALSAWRR